MEVMTDIEIIDCIQGSPEWFQSRVGLATTSKFQVVLSPRAGKEGAMRKSYLNRLAGEIITEEPSPVAYSDYNMERGKEMEPEARARYEFSARCEVDVPGFIKNNRLKAGSSPDGLIGEDGGVEIKTAYPHILIDHLLRLNENSGYFPSEHKAQVQGALMITGREWWDLVIYWPKMPLFTARTYRDENYITIMKGAIVDFNRDLEKLVSLLRDM